MADIEKHVFPKVISSGTHATIDYVHAGTNLAVAALFWNKNRKASIAALGLGLGVLANALMTDYELGVFRLYSFKVHGMLDYGAAAASAAMPELLGIKHTPEGKFFRIQGAGETMIASMTDYNDDSGARNWHGSSSVQQRLEEVAL